MSDRQKYNYRICDKCGKEWNVSKKVPDKLGVYMPRLSVHEKTRT